MNTISPYFRRLWAETGTSQKKDWVYEKTTPIRDSSLAVLLEVSWVNL